MKIGLNYRSYGDVGFVLYALKDGNIKADFNHTGIWGKPNTTRRFEITLGGDVYVFSYDYADIEDCDRKIYLTHNDWFDDNRYDRTIVTPVDSIEDRYTDDSITEFLDRGNVFLSFVSSNIDHENFIFFPLYSFVYHYYELGFKFLNYYKNTIKEHLVGAYCNKVHIGGWPNLRRIQIFDDVKGILGDDCYRFESPTSDFDMLLDSYRYFGQWYNVHMAGYSDFNSSVCSIIFETYNSMGQHVHENRIMLTEKTVKSLLFSKENLFFMWYGYEMFIPYLKEKGFWFLNFEFYDPDDRSNGETAIFNSIIKTANYLKDLKNQLGTNESVYKYLLNSYGHKLENNSQLIDSLLNNCDIKDKVINLLKYE